MVTVAPRRTAPDESVRVPRMVPVVSCADAIAVERQQRTMTRSASLNVMQTSLDFASRAMSPRSTMV